MENKTKNEVVTINMTNDEADNLEKTIENKFYEVALVGRQYSIDIALLVTEACEKKLHVLRGHEDNAAGMKAYLNEHFGIKDTQRKVYAIVAHNFAKKQEDGSYLLVSPELRDYGVGNLEQINKLPQFDEVDRNDGNAIMSKLAELGINSDTTVSQLKALRGIEDKATKKETKENVSRETSPESEDNITTQLKADNDKKTVQLEDIRTILADLYTKCLDKKMSDKDFRELAKTQLHKVENMYK